MDGPKRGGWSMQGGAEGGSLLHLLYPPLACCFMENPLLVCLLRAGVAAPGVGVPPPGGIRLGHPPTMARLYSPSGALATCGGHDRPTVHACTTAYVCLSACLCLCLPVPACTSARACLPVPTCLPVPACLCPPACLPACVHLLQTVSNGTCLCLTAPTVLRNFP